MASVLTQPTEKTLREYAEGLAARGKLQQAAALLNEHLARHDGGWGLWNTLAQVTRRMGQRALSVAASRACARQLELAGHTEHAYRVLKDALHLTPADVALRGEVARLARLRNRDRRRVPRVEEPITNPHCPIFDILDDEARQPGR